MLHFMAQSYHGKFRVPSGSEFKLPYANAITITWTPAMTREQRASSEGVRLWYMRMHACMHACMPAMHAWPTRMHACLHARMAMCMHMVIGAGAGGAGARAAWPGPGAHEARDQISKPRPLALLKHDHCRSVGSLGASRAPSR